MGGGSAIRSGRAFVELFLDQEKFNEGLRSAQGNLKSFSAKIAKIGGTMLGIDGAFAAPFALAVKAGSDLQETMNKFNIVFGKNAEAVKAWGDKFASEVGRSKAEIAGFLASTQDLFVPLGFEPGAAEDMSKELTGLAVDLASFNNMSDADVLNDLQSALTGSGEVMKKYGVLVNEAAVKQQLLNQNIDPKSATDQQKVMARLNIIMAGTTAAQGDAIRSANSYANQMKRMKAAVADTSAAIGTTLLPIITPVIEKMSALATSFSKWIEENEGAVAGTAKMAAGVIAAGAALTAIGGSISLVATGLGGLTTAVAAYHAVVKSAKAQTVGFKASMAGQVYQEQLQPELWRSGDS